jgi:uncharacterized membrane protein YhaH (DUF805 family)
MALGCIVASIVCGVVEAAGFYDESASSFALKTSGAIALIAFVAFMIPICRIILAIHAKRWPIMKYSGCKVLFSFHGRIGRGTFWAVWLSAIALVSLAGSVAHSAAQATAYSDAIAGSICFCGFVGFLIPVS